MPEFRIVQRFKMTVTRDKEPIAFCVLQALADRLGLSDLPKAIQKANIEIFGGVSIEIAAFLVFYADRWERDLVDNKAKVFREWQELVDSSLEEDYLYRVVYGIFNRKILAKNLDTEGRKCVGVIPHRRRHRFYEPVG